MFFDLFKKKEPTKIELFYNKCNKIAKLYKTVLSSRHLKVKGSRVPYFSTISSHDSCVRLETALGDRLFKVSWYCGRIMIEMLNPYIRDSIKSVLFAVESAEDNLKVFPSLDKNSEQYSMSLEEIDLALYEFEQLLIPLYNLHLKHEEAHNTIQKEYFK